MKTNYQAIEEIITYRDIHKKEIRYGIANEEEVKNVIKELSLEDKNLIELRNARDFTVLYIERLLDKEKNNNEMYWDLLSLVTYVIDCEILKRGGEV